MTGLPIKMVSGFIHFVCFAESRPCHILHRCFMSYVGYILVPGPCDPEDLLDGVIFGAKYLGSTQIKSDKTPSTNARMTQAQEAVDRIKVNSFKRCCQRGQCLRTEAGGSTVTPL